MAAAVMAAAVTLDTVKILPAAVGEPLWEADVSLSGSRNAVSAAIGILTSTTPADWTPADWARAAAALGQAIATRDAVQLVRTERLIAACKTVKVTPRADHLVSRDKKGVYRLQVRPLA